MVEHEESAYVHICESSVCYYFVYFENADKWHQTYLSASFSFIFEVWIVNMLFIGESDPFISIVNTDI